MTVPLNQNLPARSVAKRECPAWLLHAVQWHVLSDGWPEKGIGHTQFTDPNNRGLSVVH